MKSAGKARNNGLYRHIRTSKEIIRNLLNDYLKYKIKIKQGLLFREDNMTLNELKVGESAVITAVGGEGALRCRLLDMGLIPHTRVTLQKVAPMGDPIEIMVRGYELTLRVDDAKKIEVRAEEDAK